MYAWRTSQDASSAVRTHLCECSDAFTVPGYGKPWEDVYEEFLQERTGLNGIDWLCLKTGCISVWQNRIQGVPNDAQLGTLRQLQTAGLYTGYGIAAARFPISVDVPNSVGS